MNLGSPVPKHLRKNWNGKYGTYGHYKNLNDLPDTILKHILSFLETRDAAQTSVLCKRWRYMWTSLPSLVFVEQDENGYEHGERNNFMDFVDRVLHLHDAPPIRKFSLNCEVEVDDDSRIKTWICAVVRRNAQEFNFDLELPDEDVKVFPHLLFSSEAMEVLKIRLSRGDVQLPSEIFLPRLKILTLDNVIFKDHHPTNVLFASPALEELVMENCKWIVDRYELIISAPKLRSLTIDERDWRYSDVDLSLSSVTISSPELKFFNYSGGLFKAYHLPYASSIIKATLGLYNISNVLIDNFDEVLRSLQLVKYLQLSSYFVKGMSLATVPVFINLTSLEISWYEVNLSSKGAETILNKCTRLETLIFQGGISEDTDLDCLLNSKFPFLSSTLKSITIGVFKGNLVENSVVRFLLAEATFLETMKIYCSIVNVSARKHMVDILTAMPRASKSCKLDLHFV